MGNFLHYEVVIKTPMTSNFNFILPYNRHGRSERGIQPQRTLKLDSTRQTGTGVALNGLNGNGEHEVQGVAISLGAGHGRPARMREGEHPFPSAGSKRVSYKTFIYRRTKYETQQNKPRQAQGRSLAVAL